jgi:polyphosphate kinase
VVGKYLEHSRVYYFFHAGEHKYFIGSADWMHRNLDFRVEVLTPIEHPKLKRYLEFMLNLYLRDNHLRWELLAGNRHNRLKPKKGEPRISVHDFLSEHHHSGLEPIPKTY